MKRLRSRWPIAATAVALVLALGAPASGASGPWGRRPSAGSGGTAARLGKPLPALAPVERDALSRALTRGRLDEATYALERARALFDLRAVRSRYGDVDRADPREATFILRDLVLRLDELSPAQRRQARAILARPTEGVADPEGDGYTVPEETPVCSPNGCVHYVATTDDAPVSIPGYVDTALATLDNVWAKELTKYGYRPPKSDIDSPNNGGDERIDVYIADVGAEGLYGYCTTDDPNAEPGSGYEFFDYSAYCVVDNDFAPTQFKSGANGTQALRVTMAHEFFHAVQFAYDYREDLWLMESSATWIEDEVYDGINDSRQYLPKSPIGEPQFPLDSNNRFNVYGDWIFHRFLVESSGKTNIVRRIWQNADAAPGGPDQYSLKAIQTEVIHEGAKFRWMFADFAMWNDVPSAVYDEGEAYGFAPYSDRFRMTRANDRAAGSEVLDHLTSRYIWFLPGRGVQSDAKLLVTFDGPAYATGPEASVVVLFETGRVAFKPLGVDKKGRASIVVSFGKGKVAEVDLVMTNASIRRRTRCWTDAKWRYACAALPKDDDMRYSFAAQLVQ